jgi:hypothetical protein
MYSVKVIPFLHKLQLIAIIFKSVFIKIGCDIMLSKHLCLQCLLIFMTENFIRRVGQLDFDI